MMRGKSSEDYNAILRIFLNLKKMINFVKNTTYMFITTYSFA